MTIAPGRDRLEMTRTTRYVLAVLIVALLAATTACEQSFPAGPIGRVTGRDRAYFKSGGWKYWLTVNGKKFRVTRDDYRNCVRGSSYPTCTTRG